MALLVLNCGSSSLKFDLFENGSRLERGSVTGIGGRGAPASHVEAVAQSLGLLRERGLLERVQVVAHRVVHGGSRYSEPARIDAEVIAELRRLTELAPLHNGPALEAIEATARALGDAVTHVACFDTAFHAKMPKRAATYAIPAELSERHGIRRYGFHSFAHRYMAGHVAELSGLEAETLRLISLQLGAGCSAAAVRGGRSLDTSMGFTPLEGLVMAKRSGDIDPALPAFIGEHEGLAAERVHRLLDEGSGLLGVSGSSGDMEELLAAEAAGDERARLSIDLFCYRVRKYVGAYLAVLGGADALTFGGGIGEHAPEVRRRICDGMDWSGLALDARRNQRTLGGAGRIDAGGPVQVWVIPVDEAEVMARDAEALLAADTDREEDR
jgi:acetate kinase